jgi:hypothetical protein
MKPSHLDDATVLGCSAGTLPQALAMRASTHLKHRVAWPRIYAAPTGALAC